MKFKNDKNVSEGGWARILTVTDKDGDTLRVSAYIDGSPQVIFDTNDQSAVSMTRAKAIKFARAILSELDPRYT